MPAGALLLLNGPPGIGKSTVARRLCSGRALSLCLDIDMLRRSLGQWMDHPQQSGALAREMALAAAESHLRTGHGVVVPQFLGRPAFVERLEQLAVGISAPFDHVVLMADEASAVSRFLGRAHAADATDQHREADAMAGGQAGFTEMYSALLAVLGALNVAVVSSAENDVEGLPHWCGQRLRAAGNRSSNQTPLGRGPVRPREAEAPCDQDGLVLLLLAGSTCSGKTTVADLCVGVSGLVVHDFDEVGVPSDADARWRQTTLETWVQRALDYQAQGRSVLLAAQSPLGEVLACPSAPDLEGIAVCLLDVDDDERLARLERRDPGRCDESAQQAVLGWAQWHREHAADPAARPDLITAQGWEQMCWLRWATWTRGDPRWRTETISTTGRPADVTAAAVRGWISATRAAVESGEHPLRPGWV